MAAIGQPGEGFRLRFRPLNILAMGCASLEQASNSSPEIQPCDREIQSCETDSISDPYAISTYLANSAFEVLPDPSARLEETETAARRS